MFKLQYKDNPNRSIWLVGEKIGLGRNNSNDVVLESLGVDDFHAEISIFPDYLILHSEGGSCFVNSLPVDAEYQLASGDELRIGNERFDIFDPKVHADTNPVDEPAVEKPLEVTTQHWKIIADHPKLKQKDFTVDGRSVLGRAKECEFSVPYKLLSREHAALTVEGSELYVEDLGSSNGCFVNGERVQKAVLTDGDKVAFAKLAFTVVAPSAKGSSPSIKVKPTSSVEEINKTIIRPAVDINAAVAKAKRDNKRQGSISVAVGEADESSSADQSTISSAKGRWIAVAAILVLVVVGFWISPLNTFA